MPEYVRREEYQAVQARLALVERQLEAAQREAKALRLARDVALKIATWGGRRAEAEPSGR